MQMGNGEESPCKCTVFRTCLLRMAQGYKRRKYLAPFIHIRELVAEFAVVGVKQFVVLRTHLRKGCDGAS